MKYMERLAAAMLLRDKFATLHGSAFEDFFKRLLSLCDESFVDVRTAGRLGDMGADGLTLSGRRLFACYAPETLDVSNVTNKFRSDLDKAKSKRRDQFDEFAFVHNDLRGVHPLVSGLLAEARDQNPDIRFLQIGFTRCRSMLSSLRREQVEDLLECPLPITDLVIGVGADELAPLLQHLQRERNTGAEATVGPVSELKMQYNEIEDNARDVLLDGIRYSPQVAAYYLRLRDATERDEVARAFHSEYLAVRAEYKDVEDVLWQLEVYVLGNELQPPRIRRAAQAVIAYFFEACDIFEEPSSTWLELKSRSA